MNALSRRPSLSLRGWSVLTRALLWLVLLAWLMFAAAMAALHYFIVPRIDALRPVLEEQGSQALGLPLRIGALRADVDGLLLTFELQDVQLQDREGETALHLPKVLVTLTPMSILRLGFDQIAIESPELTVRRSSDGRIHLAGIEIPQQSQGDGAGIEWVLDQTEWLVRGGRIVWHDEVRAAAPLPLHDVDLRLRKRLRWHEVRLDATPPVALGERFSLRGRFRQELLALDATDWQRWGGMLYAVAGRVDVDTLQQYVSLPPTLKTEIRGGQGALRAWLDVEQGRVSGVAADLALSGLALRLGPTLPQIELEYLRGRFEGSVQGGSYVLASEGLDFRTRDGLRWQGGGAQVSYAQAQGRKSEEGQVRLSDIDLSALAALAQRLPLAPPVHAALDRFAPQGRIDRLDLSWQGARDATGLPPRYKLSGQISDLNVAAQTAADNAEGKPQPGLPGVRNLNLGFNADEKGGRANVRVQRGHLEWPGVFETPRLALDRLTADVQWRGGMQAPRSLQVSRAQVSNADFEGDFQLKWDATSQAEGAAAQRSPGLLDLQANLSRARLPAVHRYFPQAVPAPVRAYLRDAMTQGNARNVRARLRGDLRDFPFHDGRPGEFRITAQVQNARLAYVPQWLLPAESPPWPALARLQGEFLLDRTSLQLSQVSARVENAPALQLRQSSARIPDFMRDARVQVDLRLDGPLDEMLQGVVQPSPLDKLLGGVLTQASAAGDAQAQVQFEVPFGAVRQSTVQGQVRFGGNSFRFIPGMPPLTQVRGALHFNEKGFVLDGAQGQFLGGAVQAEGGSIALPQGAGQGTQRGTGVLDAMQELLREAGRKTGLDMLRDEAQTASPGASPRRVLRIRGFLTAQGLRQGFEQVPPDSDLASAAFLARHTSGDASYALDMDFSQGGLPEMDLQTTLQGLALDWPAPLNKPADAALPLRIQIRRLADGTPPAAEAGAQKEAAGLRRSMLGLDLGQLAKLRYVRVHETDASGNSSIRVQGGGIVLNLTPGGSDDLPGEEELLARTSVTGQMRFGELNLDAWREFGLESEPAPSPASASPAPASARGTAAPSPYFPVRWTMQGDVLRAAGQRLQDLKADGSHEGRRWRVNLSARELDGYFEYQLPEPGTEDSAIVHVRLAHLLLGAEQPDAAETPSGTQSKAAKAPARLSGIPGLDVVIERLELGDKKLGRLEVQAVNRGTAPVEWQLNRLRLTMPEAEFTANGVWTAAGAARQESDAEAPRQTVMDFDLDVRNAGRLLGRLGMPGVIRAGEGKMQGQVKWTGSPLSPDIPSMSGSVNLNIEKGQFLKADPGIAKLLGVLSLQTLPRRLMLDFRDVFSEGFAFDFVRGDARIEDGQARTNNLQMKGVNAGVLMSGSADLIQETQDLRVVIVPEINAGTAALIAAWINPAVGLTTFLAQAILSRPLIASATQEFHVTGSWTEPQVRKVARVVPQTSGTPSVPSDTQ